MQKGSSLLHIKANKNEDAGNIEKDRTLDAKSIAINEDGVMGLVNVCTNIEIKFIFTPNETHTQLVMFSISIHVDVIVAEFSDLFMCGCLVFLFKGNFNNRCFNEIRFQDDFNKSTYLILVRWWLKCQLC